MHKIANLDSRVIAKLHMLSGRGIQKQADVGAELVSTAAKGTIDMGLFGAKAITNALIAAPVIGGIALGKLHSMADEPSNSDMDTLQSTAVDSELNRQLGRFDRLVDISKTRSELKKLKKNRTLRLS